MKALRVHGGDAASRRISLREGGREPMAPVGVEVPESNASLKGLDGGMSALKRSSKAEEG